MISKKYNKLMGSTMTAALVATAIVPTAGLAAEEIQKPFSDVELGTPYTEPIKKLKEAGVMAGYPDGTFGIRTALTRAHAAIMFTNIRDLDTSVAAAPFADVKQDVYYTDAINAAYAADVIKGHTEQSFAPNDNLTRGEMAVMMVQAYGLEQVTDVELPFSDLKEDHWATPFIKTLYANGLFNGKSTANGAIAAIGENVDRGDFAILLSATDIKFGHKLGTEEPTELVVKSVKAINAKQVEVIFNTAIDADTVITDAGTNDILLGSVKVTADANAEAITAANLEGELSKDGKTLTITNVSDTEFFDGKYTVTVDDSVLSVGGKELTPFITKLEVADTTAPAVTGISYEAASDEVTVALSEAIVANPTVLRVNGAPVAFTNATNAPVTELTFARPASVVTGSSATVYIAGAEDFNGNAFTAFNGSVTFTKDASALGVSAFSQADSDTLTVQFNKKLGAKTTTALDDLQAALSLVVDAAPFTDYSVAATPGDTTGTKFDINFTSADLYGNATSEDLTILLAKDGLVDIYGNTNPATTSAVKMVKDTVAPTVAGTSVSNDKQTMSVSFSEGVTIADGTKFVVRRDGIATAVTVQSDATDAKKVEIVKSDGTAFAAGTYSIRIEAGAVADLVELNVNALTTATASVTSGTSTTTNLVSAVSNGTTANTFKVSFSDNAAGKEVTTAALNASNYKLDGKALPANTDIYFEDTNKKVVVIELPAGSINFGEVGTGANAILSVSGVKSTDGKTVVSSSSTVLVEDNTVATLTSATKSGNSVIATFSEAISATNLDATDFVITTSTGATVATGDYTALAVAGKSNQVQLTFDAIPAGAVTVKTAAATILNLTDSNLLEVLAGSQVVAN